MTQQTAIERMNRLAAEMAATTPKARKAKTPKACACNCGGLTKGGNWLPGHDGIYLGRKLAEAREQLAVEAKQAASQAA